MTDRTKTICPPIFNIGDIKIKGKGTAEKYKHLKQGNHIFTDKKEISNIIGQTIFKILQ